MEQKWERRERKRKAKGVKMKGFRQTWSQLAATRYARKNTTHSQSHEYLKQFYEC